MSYVSNQQMQQQINTLNAKVAILSTRHFGRSTEKLETLLGQMNIFNETEVAAAEAIAEPTGTSSTLFTVLRPVRLSTVWRKQLRKRSTNI